jgi:hypothetical protein
MANNPDGSYYLQTALEPRLAIAAQRYPQVVALLTAYDEATDRGDGEKVQAIIEMLQQLIDKPITEADLFEYYEASSKEELAIQLALPAPQLVEHISRPELVEIVRRLQEPPAPALAWSALSVEEQISSYYLADYYHGLLKLNFPTRYRYHYFGRCKGAGGQYYTLSTEEIVAKLLD